MDVVRALRPELDVRTAFLDLSAPRLSDVLSAVHHDGHEEAVVVPLLLGRAFHASVDVPAAVADLHRRHPRLRVHVADVLGPDRRLERAAWRRLAAAGARADDARLGVVLAAAGSSHDPANRLVTDVAARWQARASWAGAVAAFAAAAEPDVATAVATLRARGARRLAVGLWFLAPGLLPDGVLRAARGAAGDAALAAAAPLGADRGVAELVLQRYDAALAAAQPRLARAL
jgi:sirohydrochlorin ferrochelatase